MPNATVRNNAAGRESAVPLVLVVDDVDDNRVLYTNYLAHHGFRVEQAVDGEDALSKTALHEPDVIVMDLAMPILNGWEAIRRIKSDERTKDIVVIAITGHVYGENLQRAQTAGADAVLIRPCLPQDLLEMVRQFLE